MYFFYYNIANLNIVILVTFANPEGKPQITRILVVEARLRQERQPIFTVRRDHLQDLAAGRFFC
jgi:hypothetical protein